VAFFVFANNRGFIQAPRRGGTDDRSRFTYDFRRAREFKDMGEADEAARDVRVGSYTILNNHPFNG
jgi:hypothetical protein